MNSFAILQNYVDYLLDSDTTLLIVKSRGGLGKTYTVLETLKKRNKTIDVDFAYLSGFTTPLECFNFLLNNQDKLIVLDDLEGLLKEKKNLGMLKSATFPTIENQRVVQYQSSKMEQEQSVFICSSKFILLCNETPRGSDWNAIQSRGIYYSMKPLNDEIFEQILNIKDCDLEIVDYMRNILKQHNPVNFRMYNQSVGIKKVFPDTWKTMVLPILQISSKYTFIRNLLNSKKAVSEQIEAYKTQGLSRMSYYRHKKEALNE